MIRHRAAWTVIAFPVDDGYAFDDCLVGLLVTSCRPGFRVTIVGPDHGADTVDGVDCPFCTANIDVPAPPWVEASTADNGRA